MFKFLRRWKYRYLRELVTACRECLQKANEPAKIGISLGLFHPRVVMIPKDGAELFYLPSGTSMLIRRGDDIRFRGHRIPTVETTCINHLNS